MDFSSLKQRSPDDLKRDLQESMNQLKALEFKLSSNQVKNVREARVLKKTIARIQTLLRKPTST